MKRTIFKKKLVTLTALSAMAVALMAPVQASAESKEAALTVPLRYAAEQIGATVTWDSETNRATVTRGGNTFVVTIGDDTALLNSTPVHMGQGAALVDDKTVVPFDSFKQAFGIEARLSGATGELAIDQQDVTTLGSHFIYLMKIGKFDDAHAMLNEKLQQAIPAALLRQIWQVNTFGYGQPEQLSVIQHEQTAVHNNATLRYITDRSMPFGFTIRFDSSGKVDDLFLPVPAPGSYIAPDYDKPDRYTEEEVVVGQGDFKLPGTLTLPQGDGPFPAVVLVHGSGPNDRDESNMGYKTFHDLAVGLADKGYAVLRYEKRTREHLVKSALNPMATVKEETVDDALEAARLLAGDKRIDAKHVFVIGHSQGGMLVPRIIEQDQSKLLAGAIVMAGPSDPLENLMIYQNNFSINLAAEKGLEPSLINALKQQAESWEHLVELLHDPNLNIANPPKELLQLPSLYWWYDIRNYKGAEIAKNQSLPMFVIQGENDWQVPAAQLDGWKKTLSARTNVEYKTYPKLNHFFVSYDKPSTGEEYAIPGNVPASVIDDLAAWMDKQK